MDVCDFRSNKILKMSATINMHPLLENFNMFFSYAQFTTDEEAITFLEEVGLIPAKDAKPPICCGMRMKVEEVPELRLFWRWRCSTKAKKIKGVKECRKTINPATGTFFDGSVTRFSIRDTLFMIFAFVLDFKATNIYTELKLAHQNEGGSILSRTTVHSCYKRCREIAEVVASHSDTALRDKGATTQIDEIFLARRNYSSSHVTEQMGIVALGLYCQRNKTGLFFKVNSKTKADLWPHVLRYTDNKWSNRSIICRKSLNSKYKSMGLNFYRHNVLGKFNLENRGARIMQFLNDIKRVYPPIKDGVTQIGLKLREIDPPDSIESPDNGLVYIQAISSREDDEMMTIEAELDAASDEEKSVSDRQILHDPLQLECLQSEPDFYGYGTDAFNIQ